MYQPFHLNNELEINGEQFILETSRLFPIRNGAEYHDKKVRRKPTTLAVGVCQYPFYTFLWKGKPSAPILKMGHRNAIEAEKFHNRLVIGLSGLYAREMLEMLCSKW